MAASISVAVGREVVIAASNASDSPALPTQAGLYFTPGDSADLEDGEQRPPCAIRKSAVFK